MTTADDAEAAVDATTAHEPDGAPRLVSAAATGVPAADAALARLAEARSLPLDAQVDAYDEVHRLLQEGLADLDSA